MKKLVSVVSSMAFAAALAFFVIPTSSSAAFLSAGSKKPIRTKCVIKGTDTVVGYANDCGGSGQGCIDTTCDGGAIQ